MLPKRPPRPGQVGFLYVSPFRVQGVSVAGEESCVQIPELDVAFDIGMCPRIALASPYIALSHAHMDHIGGLPYYFSQRNFLKMGVGTCICHAAIEAPLKRMMEGWIPLEDQRTPHNIIGVNPGEHVEVKNNILLRAVEMSHTVPALGYALVEKRSKLKEEFQGQPQSRLRDLKREGVQITRTLDIPLVAYSGDTEMCPGLYTEEFCGAKIVITECTFFENDHRSRSRVGKHLHVDDIVNLLKVWRAEAVILVHISRRTNIAFARQCLLDAAGPSEAQRVHFLMDHRTNRSRFDEQERALARDGESDAEQNAPDETADSGADGG